MRRLQRIAGSRPKQSRKSVAYVAVFGSKLYGSGRNTNYADVFHYAGVIDRSAERYEDFPEYSAEQVLELDPDLIVAREGTRGALCGYPGLAGLRVCRDPAHLILELPEAVISSAGPEMLLAAEAVNDFAYGNQN
jgi:ABC-type hemin transport system substrate-binding protein